MHFFLHISHFISFYAVYKIMYSNVTYEECYQLTSMCTCPIMQVHDLCLLRLLCLLSLLQLLLHAYLLYRYSHLFTFFYTCMPTCMQLQYIIFTVMAYANLQSTMATCSLPSVLPSLLYTTTAVCLPSLHYNNCLYAAQSMLPTKPAYSVAFLQLYTLSGLHGYPVCHA